MIVFPAFHAINLSFTSSMRSVSLILAWLVAQLCHGQSLRFQHLTTDQGLSDNTINCIYKDHEGYLWIGTERGLDRYDGQRVDQVPGNTFAIAGIVEDAHGVLWVATKDHGLLRVDRQLRTTIRFHHAPDDAQSLANDQLTAVFDLNDTTLLLGSREHSLIFMDKRSRAFTYWADSTSLDPSRAQKAPTARSGWCHTIKLVDDHTIWVGLLNIHLSFLVDRTSLSIRTHLIVQRPGSETQTCMLRFGDTLFSGGWQKGLDAIALGGDQGNSRQWIPRPEVIATPDEVLSLVAWSDGTILAGTRGSGILQVEPISGTTGTIRHRRSEPSSLPSDRVRCMLVDHTGTLWIGTANGLAYHVPQVWKMHSIPLIAQANEERSEIIFHRLEAEGSDGVRVFTSQGFFLQSSAGQAVRHVPVTWQGNDMQPTFLLRRKNDVLIGTEYGFLRQHSLDGQKSYALNVHDGHGFTHHPGDMYQIRHVSTDTYDGRSVLVVGTLGFGVNVIDLESMTLMGFGMPPAAQGLKGRSLISDMVRDQKGTYWIASGDGLYSWNYDEPLTTGTEQQAQPIEEDGILAKGSSISKLSMVGEVLWAASRDGRLIRVHGDSIRSYSPPWKINEFHGMCTDTRGRTWISSDEGLVRFDPSDDSFLRIPVNDGLEYRKLTRAIATMPDGQIAFATNNTLFRFDPAAFDPLPALPKPFIATTMVAGEPLQLVGSEALLSYRASVIDIGISALAFDFPRPLEFEYRLDGIENEWRATSANVAIRYAGIPVGKHHLLVRVKDPYGRTGPSHVLLTIAVNGPFWQQWWFYALAASIISIGIYGWSRYRLTQTLKIQDVRNRIASDLHDEVGSSLSSITIGSKLAAQLSTSESAQVKEILARIGETSSESLRSISDIVWAIDPKNDQGEALVKRMRRIANELLESKGIDVSFSIASGVEELKLPMNARKEIVLIYKEAIHNASKYSGATRVQVSLQLRNGALSLCVQDNGNGFDPALHTDGHGLGSMRRRAGALGIVLDLRSTSGTGTHVGLEVDLTNIRD